MVCSKEEFLLVLKNWMSSSQRVVLSVVLAENSGSSITSIFRVVGNIKNIDSEVGAFVLAGHSESLLNGDFAFVGIDDWEIAFADPLENPALTQGLVGVQGPIREALSLTRPNRAKITLFAY